MKVLGIRFTEEEMMNVRKCDGVSHWTEHYNQDLLLKLDYKHSACTCVKKPMIKRNLYLACHP